ncbi:MAG: translation initiation factor IF-2 [Candidatus Gracilibacteria bacterium]|nr:translation initiation factor IF-2 [Candidatus Gracilibacteria bacterium]
MTQTNTNIDDYYSQIPANTDDDKKESGKPAVKLKIKAKKVEVAEEQIETPVKEEESFVEPKENLSRLKIKKPGSTITFEAAPKKAEVIKEVRIETNQFKSEKTERFNREEKFERKVELPEKKEKPEEIEKNVVSIIKEETSIDSDAVHAKFGSQKKELKTGFSGGFSKDKPKGGFSHQNDYSEKRFGGKKSYKMKGFSDEDDGSFRRSKKSFDSKREKSVEDIKQTLVDKTGLNVAIPDFLTVKEFSEKIGIVIPKIIGEFLKNGMMVNLNSKVDFDTCFIIAETFGIKVIKDKEQAVSMASLLEGNISELIKNEDPAKAIERSPIISIMGHVDHGKTSILDYIRKTQVASGEAGGITQKIGAYQVDRDGKKITFLDTPGHEAFSIMRARGAKLTDIAIIVVAGDEGMKPQTIESINHAKEAGVPIIVAVNKMDKPGANIDLVKGQLAEQGLQPEDWGGTTVVVPVSAHTGLGIETLLDMILLVSEMQELKANPERSAIATIIESHLDAKLGPLATLLVNTGTLRKGDVVTCAQSFGRIKFLKDFKGKNIESAGPSTPILISGLNEVVEGGDILQVVADVETARAKSHDYKLVKSSRSINKFEGASLELLLNRIKTGNLKQLKIVLKAESNGSLEALKEALFKLGTAEIKTHIIHSGVGEINDSDVLMAGTSQAILVGYNVGYVGQAKHTLNNSKIEVINKKVIYHILEKIESIITGMIDIKHEDLDLGEAKVKQIFFNSKERLVLGLEATSGKIENKAKIRVIRNGKKIGNGEVVSLKSGVMDVHEIEAPSECGIAFKGEVKVEVGDLLEFYKVVQRKG